MVSEIPEAVMLETSVFATLVVTVSRIEVFLVARFT
jgi:hypothetical protein